MRPLAVLTLVVTFAGASRADDDAIKVNGTWTIDSVVRDGKDDPSLKGGTRIHEGTHYEVRPAKGPVIDGTYRFDASKSPAEFDQQPTAGRYKGKTLLGIGKLTGDTFVVGFSEPGQPRPTAFDSKPGSGLTVVTLSKVK